MDAMRALFAGLVLFREAYPTMPIQRAAMFLGVVLKEGCTRKDLEKWTNVEQTTVSRNMRELGQWTRHNVPGEDLVRAENSEDGKTYRYYLTAKGKLFADGIRKRLEMEGLNA